MRTLNLTVFYGWKAILNLPISSGAILSVASGYLHLKNSPSMEIQLTSSISPEQFLIGILSIISNSFLEVLKLIFISLDRIWYGGGWYKLFLAFRGED